MRKRSYDGLIGSEPLSVCAIALRGMELARENLIVEMENRKERTRCWRLEVKPGGSVAFVFG
jgi:hypothetical protein